MLKIIATNRQARRDYTILDTLEAGVELRGGEVKSLRSGGVNLKDSFARIEGDEIFLYNIHITPYREASYLNVEPTRVRKLLLHKSQIRHLKSSVNQKGFTLIPLKIYFNEGGFAKIELALTRGKKLYDRREDIKKREAEREIHRAMRRKTI